jgi:D-tyrosyl-tRNA(Tyr) deacylase
VKILLQRVKQAAVRVEGREVSAIGKGLLVFAAVEKGDTIDAAGGLAKKIAEIRVFEDAAGKMNLSCRDAGGEILLVPQFTLAASCKKGTRPSFDGAESPERAASLLADLAGFLRDSGLPVREGVFGARMEVSLVNDGPVTFLLP